MSAFSLPQDLEINGRISVFKKKSVNNKRSQQGQNFRPEDSLILYTVKEHEKNYFPHYTALKHIRVTDAATVVHISPGRKMAENWSVLWTFRGITQGRIPMAPTHLNWPGRWCERIKT
jgi:hypothetical protein